MCRWEAGREKKETKRAKNNGKGKERKRGLCHIACGYLTGFAVLSFWLNQAIIWAILKAGVKIIVKKGSMRNLMKFFSILFGGFFTIRVFAAIVRHLE